MSDAQDAPSRRKSAQSRAVVAHPIGTPTTGTRPNTGPLATALWLVHRGVLPSEPKWFAEITLPAEPVAAATERTTLRVELFSEEWGYELHHDGKVSWIRVTDLPFVHGRDDHGLLESTPPLKNFGVLVRAIEERFAIRFVPHEASIRTSLEGAEPAIVEWITSW